MRSGNGAAPSMGQSMGQIEVLLRDPEGPALLSSIERNPKLLRAAMDIASNGNAADYKDPEVVAFLQKLEEITRRGGGQAPA